MSRAARSDVSFDPLDPSGAITTYRCIIWCLLYANDIVLLADSAGLQQQLDIMAEHLAKGGRIDRACHNMCMRMVATGAARWDPQQRLLPHADLCNTLKIKNPLAIMKRIQLRHLRRLLSAHRERPHTVTMVVAGRLDPAAYPEAYPTQQQ